MKKNIQLDRSEKFFLCVWVIGPLLILSFQNCSRSQILTTTTASEQQQAPAAFSKQEEHESKIAKASPAKLGNQKTKPKSRL